MRIFRKPKTVLPMPEGYSAEDIRVESSVCTGEKTIGFYNSSEKKLVCAELIRTEADIDEFYEKYGADRAVSPVKQSNLL